MRVNYINSDHVHALIDLPTTHSVSKAVQLLKGSFSRWITQQSILPGEFAWARGYGAFSVSPRDVDRVAHYIANQEAHHQQITFKAEYRTMTKIAASAHRKA